MEILKKLSETENFGDKIKGEIIIYLKELLDDKTKKVYHFLCQEKLELGKVL